METQVTGKLMDGSNGILTKSFYTFIMNLQTGKLLCSSKSFYVELGEREDHSTQDE